MQNCNVVSEVAFKMSLLLETNAVNRFHRLINFSSILHFTSLLIRISVWASEPIKTFLVHHAKRSAAEQLLYKK